MLGKILRNRDLNKNDFNENFFNVYICKCDNLFPLKRMDILNVY